MDECGLFFVRRRRRLHCRPATQNDPTTGVRDFVDGQRRAVHIDDDGNQYVYDDAGVPVFGVWIAPEAIDADPPVFIARIDDVSA
jgi:hypothetical protein